ncbi:deoxyguanosinetriphosphate triphosphohydrolase [Streptomyces sp. AJS327]|uniref:deoxyguanosinetriphosphate triphosphohydrolase n=1 Tax=Streptomyces sp. AJS327 TaxID=2545265 RepID=UPI0015DEE6C1|nr:deoxyguanosinetriphosphate triphosphohydrolase [Streptomyces sp. AJS327]MBA0049938.1 deoxyguanosinetriphosphate triphosphohydrolase [Streptomyces sp. AJS327]
MRPTSTPEAGEPPGGGGRAVPASGAPSGAGAEGPVGPASGYAAADVERWVPEPDKRPGRTAFERDRARVLHSAALRRLAGKTQMVAPGSGGGGPGDADDAVDAGHGAAASRIWDAAPRTRLTHSLECAQVGRELGAALGCAPDLVEVACLAHDLGHPPFGHNGERALAEIAEPCGGFEGNAQSLRLLTRLEPKRFSPESPGSPGNPGGPENPGGPGGGAGRRSVGLNLTRAALDAATKYPWFRGGDPADPESAKFGVYADDGAVFAWFRRGAPAHRRCFEAQVMDWADDVAYSVHDVEDGLRAGYLDPATLLSGPERRAVFEVAVARYAPDADREELGAALDRLLAQDWWPHGYDGTALAQARLKDATSQLIGRFCVAAERATRAAFGPGRLTRYAADLVVPRAVRLECAVLKAVADLYVMQRPDLERLRAEQRVILAELAEALAERAPEGFDPRFRELFQAEAADGAAARLRVTVDQIASLTDASARSLHRHLTA